MNNSEIIALTHALKGAPLSCLFIMLFTRRAMGINELSVWTGYDRKTIGQSMQKLQVLGLATSTQRYNGWSLTNQGYQLPLSTTGGENPPLAQRSSSFKLHESVESTDSLKEQQLQNREGEILPLPEEYEEIVDMLVNRCGCPRRTAEPSVQMAMKVGETSEFLEIEILCWLAYYHSDHGKGIRNPGVFIASKIKNGEQIPDWFSPNGEYAQEILRLQRERTAQ